MTTSQNLKSKISKFKSSSASLNLSNKGKGILRENRRLSLKVKDWHLIDAKNQILGRLATGVAYLLMGKNKAYFSPYLDIGDNVVVINAAKIVLSGKKEKQKVYWRHSGYPGGLKSKTAATIRAQKPQELVRHAIVGMLPKTKLARLMLKKLYIYPAGEHPHKDKFKES